jgi:hypothetical protein
MTWGPTTTQGATFSSSNKELQAVIRADNEQRYKKLRAMPFDAPTWLDKALCIVDSTFCLTLLLPIMILQKTIIIAVACDEVEQLLCIPCFQSSYWHISKPIEHSVQILASPPNS